MCPYKIQSLAGKPYTPSNGTEGRMFESKFCLRCRRDDWFRETATKEYGEQGDHDCKIWHGALMGEQQVQWTHDWQGCPTCTAFEEYNEDNDGNPDPPYEPPYDPRQLLLFDLDKYSYGTLGDLLENWKSVEKEKEYERAID